MAATGPRHEISHVTSFFTSPSTPLLPLFPYSSPDTHSEEQVGEDEHGEDQGADDLNRDA
jgi:hypothetical protein